MATANMQDRSQYLTLALFSQAIVSVLMDYVDENKTARLKNSLAEALHSLQQTQNPSVSPQRKAVAFTSYEHLRTLEQVWHAEDRANAIKDIRKVLSAPHKGKSKAIANNLIDFFSKLQVQALWNFEQPRPVSPKVMQRLCKLA